MIATILPGSANFHAVGYNEHKVRKGKATLIEMLNIGLGGLDKAPTEADIIASMKAYSSTSQRIQKPQFHVAISCKGQEMTVDELLDFAHRYLKEMGYLNPGQPTVIYAHHDTANLHLHIVTTRIGPDGRKINDHNERRRSNEIVDRLMNINRVNKVDKDCEDAKAYTFSSMAQFKAVLNSMGYECYEKNALFFIKYGGRVKKKIPVSEIEALFADSKRDRARCRQLRSILKKYRDMCSSKEELQKELKQKFGIDLVFFGRKDNPFGYLIIDHVNKTVIHGARVLKMDELLDFATPEQRFDRIEAFIDSLFDANPKITQGEIYDKLHRMKAYIKKGEIVFDGQTRALPQFMVDALKRNGKIRWIEGFRPATEAERDVLCSIAGITANSMVDLADSRDASHADAVSRISNVFNDTNPGSIWSKLRNEGFSIREENGIHFAIDYNKRIIVNLEENGFDITRLVRQQPRQQQKQPKHPKTQKGSLPNPFRAEMGHGENREWEVGYRGNYDKIDEGQNSGMKM